MTPYYQLIHGDCLIEMDKIADNSIDMILADLPYKVTENKWDSMIPLEPLWKHYKRIIKPRGAIVLSSVQPFASLLIVSNLEWFKYEVIWQKTMATDFLNGNNKPLRAHENILVFSPGTVANCSPNLMTYNPQVRLARAWRKAQRSDPRVRNYGGPDKGREPFEMGAIRGREGRLPTTVIEFSNGNHFSLHPTQKPTDLLEYLIKTYSSEGDTILDNTMGSGSTGEACLGTGRRFIGIEKDAGYFEIASQRLANVARELRGEWKPLADNGKGLEDLPMFAGQ